MRQVIPNFAFPTTKGETRRFNAAKSVPPAFVELTATTTANNPVLARDTAKPDEIRDLMAYAEAYAPFADELEALVRFVRHSVAAAKHRVGSEALATYSLAQRLAKLPETAYLAPHVDAMRDALGKRGRNTKAKSQKPQTPETPSSAGTTPQTKTQ